MRNPAPSPAPPQVHLAAPIVHILSTYFGSDNDYLPLSGTSTACPMVSGSAALLFSALPQATAEQVK